MKKRVLVVIDAQNDFLTGALPNPAAVAALPAIKKLVDEAIAAGDRLVYTQDTHTKDYLDTHEGKNLPIPHCIADTEGWEIADAVKPDKDHEACSLLKWQFGADPEDWQDMLGDKYADNGAHFDIHLCGFVSSICVVSNALILRALFPEADITFHAYASAGLTPEDHEAACKVMECCQIKVLREAE